MKGPVFVHHLKWARNRYYTESWLNYMIYLQKTLNVQKRRTRGRMLVQFYPEDISLHQRVVPEDVAAAAAAFAVQSSHNLLDSGEVQAV